MRDLSKTIFAAILILETVAIPKLSAAGFTQEKNIVYGHKHGLGLLWTFLGRRNKIEQV